jgi:hypothetical protein
VKLAERVTEGARPLFQRPERRIALGVIAAAWIGAGTALAIANRLDLGAGAFALSGFFALLAWGTLPDLRRKR